METSSKIQTMLRSWFPDVYPVQALGPYGDYAVLNHFAQYCAEHWDADICAEIFKIINILYTKGSLHDKNAIENEFLCMLSEYATFLNVKTLCRKFPETIRPVFIRSLIEN
jgi:hypothetical protein